MFPLEMYILHPDNMPYEVSHKWSCWHGCGDWKRPIRHEKMAPWDSKMIKVPIGMEWQNRHGRWTFTKNDKKHMSPITFNETGQSIPCPILLVHCSWLQKKEHSFYTSIPVGRSNVTSCGFFCREDIATDHLLVANAVSSTYSTAFPIVSCGCWRAHAVTSKQ